MQWAEKNCHPEAVKRLRSRAVIATLAAEVRRCAISQHSNEIAKLRAMLATVLRPNVELTGDGRLHRPASE